MKILHMGGFSQSELIQYKNAMRGNVIDAMATVLREISSKNIEFQFEVKITDPLRANFGKLFEKLFNNKKFGIQPLFDVLWKTFSGVFKEDLFIFSK